MNDNNKYFEVYEQTDGARTAEFRSDGLLFSEETGRNRGGARNVEASNLLRSVPLTNPKAYGSWRAEQSARGQQEKLVRWARENGCFFDEESHIEIGKLPHDKDTWGMESEVYKYGDCYVLKIMDYSRFSRRPIDFLDDRITKHNMVFPEAPYELLGIMHYQNDEGDDVFYFVTRQPIINAGETDPTPQEIEEDMAKKGFVKDISNSYVLKGKHGETLLRARDCHTKNFIKTARGNIICIDSVVERAIW